jgi:methionyl-tRNA synthetase
VHKQKWNEALKPLPANHKIAQAKPLFQKIEANEQELEEMLEKVRETSAKNS